MIFGIFLSGWHSRDFSFDCQSGVTHHVHFLKRGQDTFNVPPVYRPVVSTFDLSGVPLHPFDASFDVEFVD